MVAALILVIVGLVLLVVLTLNERLVRIEDGRITWPFPYIRMDGRRTRYVSLDEINETRYVRHPDGRRGLKLVLGDGIQMFLPQSTLGGDSSDVLDRIVRYANHKPHTRP